MSESLRQKQLNIIKSDTGFSDPGIGKIYRNSAKFFAYLFIRTKLTPNQITVIGLVLGLVACFLLLKGNYYLNILAVAIFHIRLIFDFVDGMVARAKNMCSDYGEWLDRIFDRLIDPMLISCVAFALYQQTGDFLVWVFALIAVIGIMFNSSLLTITKLNYPDIDKEVKTKVEVANILKYFVFSIINFYLLFTLLTIFNQLYLFLIIVAIYSNLFYFTSLIYLMIKLKRNNSKL